MIHPMIVSNIHSVQIPMVSIFVHVSQNIALL